MRPIIFDFDGPLVEFFDSRSGALAVREIHRIAEQAGVDFDVPAEGDRFVSAWARARSHAGLRDLGSFDRDVHAALERLEHDLADARDAPASALAMLDRLAVRGAKVGIVSNNAEGAILSWLRRHRLQSAVSAVVGRDPNSPFEGLKPNPRGLHLALQAMGERRSPIFIGDTEADRQCAEAAGADFVWFVPAGRRSPPSSWPSFSDRDELSRFLCP